MHPLSPVIPSADADEVVYAEKQPEYANLPSIRTTDGIVLTRWSVSEEEKRKICEQGYIYLLVNTYAGLPPLMVTTEVPNDMGFELRPLAEWPSEIDA